MANWVFPKRLTAARRRWAAGIFGRNTWKFGTKLCIAIFEGKRSSTPYKIIWANEQSAVVVFGRGAEQSCHQLFFEGEHFYLVAGANGNVEYFKHAV